MRRESDLTWAVENDHRPASDDETSSNVRKGEKREWSGEINPLNLRVTDPFPLGSVAES